MTAPLRQLGSAALLGAAAVLLCAPFAALRGGGRLRRGLAELPLAAALLLLPPALTLYIGEGRLRLPLCAAAALGAFFARRTLFLPLARLTRRAFEILYRYLRKSVKNFFNFGKKLFSFGNPCGIIGKIFNCAAKRGRTDGGSGS